MPSIDPMIALDGVSKRYHHLADDAMLLRSVLPFARRSRTDLWALQDVNLRVGAGETLGIVGNNGAGKTTLLRMIAGVTRPTEGRVEVRGRIAPLISLGVGFDSEMSGRENVMVNGMLLGLTARQVTERFDSIVELAELADFIDTPVKFYSSGMVMRLGFGVIAHIDPGIMVIDEILAVGDAEFQRKCFERLRAMRANGAAIVVVSHSMYTVRQLCTRAALLRKGRVVIDGDVETAIAQHESFDNIGDGDADSATPVVTVVAQQLVGANGETSVASYDERMELRIVLRFDEAVVDPQLAFGIRTVEGIFGGFRTTQPGRRWRTFDAGAEAEVRIVFRARVPRGKYELAVDVRDREGVRILARIDHIPLNVDGDPAVSGLVDIDACLSTVAVNP